jgi:hypothetical protein
MGRVLGQPRLLFVEGMKLFYLSNYRAKGHRDIVRYDS